MRILMISLAALSLVGARLQADTILVRVNGERVRFDGMGARQINGRVMVPLRGVLETMGVDVDWISATQTVVATKDDMTLELPIGSHTARVNRRTVVMDTPAMTIGGNTMVPLRFCSEALGAIVAWDDRLQMA